MHKEFDFDILFKELNIEKSPVLQLGQVKRILHARIQELGPALEPTGKPPTIMRYLLEARQILQNMDPKAWNAVINSQPSSIENAFISLDEMTHYNLTQTDLENHLRPGEYFVRASNRSKDCYVLVKGDEISGFKNIALDNKGLYNGRSISQLLALTQKTFTRVDCRTLVERRDASVRKQDESLLTLMNKIANAAFPDQVNLGPPIIDLLSSKFTYFENGSPMTVEQMRVFQRVLSRIIMDATGEKLNLSSSHIVSLDPSVQISHEDRAILTDIIEQKSDVIEDIIASECTIDIMSDASILFR